MYFQANGIYHLRTLYSFIVILVSFKLFVNNRMQLYLANPSVLLNCQKVNMQNELTHKDVITNQIIGIRQLYLPTNVTCA